MSEPTPVKTFDPTKLRVQQASNQVLCRNAIDEVVTIEIGTNPGSPPMIFVLEPGEACSLPRTYCEGIKGAGRDPRESVLYMLTARSAWPGGRQLQAVVPEAQYEDQKKKWAQLKKDKPKAAMVTLKTDDGSTVQVGIPTA